MTPEIVNTIGLVLDILGIVTVLYFAFPQADLNDKNYLALSGDMAIDSDVAPEQERRMFVSRLGLVLIVIGFVLQIVTTWM